MTTAATSLLGLALPVQGELDGTWGDVVNNSLTSLVDSAIAGTTTISTDANVTLTTTTLAANQARQAILNCTGARTAIRTIIAPAQSKTYVVINGTTGGFDVKIAGPGPTTGVSVPAGQRYMVAWNGSDFVQVGSTGTGDVVGPASAIDSALVAFNGTTGKLIKQAATVTVAQGGTGATTLTGVLKGNGTSAFSAATAGTDYLAPPAGTAILKANSGGALANATAGTDYVAPGTATTFTAKQTFTGSTSVAAATLTNALEKATISATAATGTIAYDVTTQSVLFYTSSASANWTVNFRASSGTTLDSIMATGESITVAFLVTQGATAYYNSAVQINGTTTGVTTRWQGGTAPTSGNASGVDAYVYTIFKTGSATFSVFASQTRYA